MGNLTLGVVLLLLTGFLWVTGAVLHWHTIRRQERIIVRLRRLELRRALRLKAGGMAVAAGPERPEELVRPSKRWTVG
jgi:hypothetical protein